MQRATTHEMKPRDNIYISLEKIDDRLSYSRVLESFYVDYMRIFFQKTISSPVRYPCCLKTDLRFSVTASASSTNAIW